MEQKYSFWKGFWKTALNVVIIVAPLLSGLIPEEWMSITLSGAILMFINWAKVTAKNKYPLN